MTAQAAYPWEAPATGPAAALATRLSALVPTLRTPRLTLRAPRLEDFDVYAEVLTSERAQFMGGPYSRETAWLDFCQYIAIWLLRGAGMFTVENEGTIVGFVTMGMEFGDHEHELGYFLTEEAEGKGFASEAATAVRDFALGDHALPSLVSYMDPQNAASAAVATGLGAERDFTAEAKFGNSTWVWRHFPSDSDGSPEAYA